MIDILKEIKKIETELRLINSRVRTLGLGVTILRQELEKQKGEKE